jgi:hypothetical protein
LADGFPAFLEIISPMDASEVKPPTVPNANGFQQR